MASYVGQTHDLMVLEEEEDAERGGGGWRKRRRVEAEEGRSGRGCMKGWRRMHEEVEEDTWDEEENE